MRTAQSNTLIMRGMAFQHLPAEQYQENYLGTASNLSKINFIHSWDALETCNVRLSMAWRGTVWRRCRHTRKGCRWAPLPPPLGMVNYLMESSQQLSKLDSIIITIRFMRNIRLRKKKSVQDIRASNRGAKRSVSRNNLLATLEEWERGFRNFSNNFKICRFIYLEGKAMDMDRGWERKRYLPCTGQLPKWLQQSALDQL